ncbi:16S rRNA (adenine(1518)-N(6)/adenine(1519)-N(6))-dimethyltransferase [Sporanaerobium hydrogeniformans]|uniref:16S rRNA (Adenine(1518)-N(6)/adenine(1519)-N(6))-dimethyltransferase n=1 Tax=Sporanaerobium hydrogeniformans TaxID=3072179 RepID=A0AC61DDX8_9FIRM|nr:16S rRNA (adenine(1518)-N(6)/adenine(1519)-N(6))-dimethyltransferase RsmA [Sporanaerobium hydrogeniformans]PHV70852.1 16S rRNA (adenine(1518)-N(6)/adenine(1519)-N(6))-dimethyltransferase [Sporanaerobium hydrogeniformans]
MQKIATPEGTKAILNKYAFIFQKKFGQNFLIDPHVLDKIIKSSDITKKDCVLEIGPGIGSVTQALIENAGKVISVEIDKQLIPILEEQFGKEENFKLIHNDILKVDLMELIKKESPDRPIKVVANLPYYITTPIIMALLENELPIESITVMVQKEVADRLASPPGSKQYGAITVSVNYFAKPYLVANVPRNCFMPRPNVDSAVLKLTLNKEPVVEVNNKEQMFRIIKSSFLQRRKTLLNTLGANAELGLSKEVLKELLDRSEIGATTRGETLSLQDFARLSNFIDENRK